MKLGVIVDNLGPNQLAYNVIKAGNFLKGCDYIVFYENFLKPCIPTNFATMQMFEAWGYDGTMIATNLSSASQLSNFPLVKHRYFYIWDLEWLRMKEKHFRPLAEVYRNPNLILIARSENHKNVIETCWNVKVAGIVDDFEMSQLYEVVQCHKS